MYNGFFLTITNKRATSTKRQISSLFLSSFLLILLFLPSISISHANESEPLSLNWIDLIPEDERNSFAVDFATINNQINHNVDQAPQPKFGSMRQDLDGKLVRIPGFVIPLEGDNEVVTELLLVPYMGACIHVPPPPPNQIVYVKFEQGTPLTQLWETVIIEGTLRVHTTNSDLAEVGYLLEGIKVLPYEE